MAYNDAASNGGNSSSSNQWYQDYIHGKQQFGMAPEAFNQAKQQALMTVDKSYDQQAYDMAQQGAARGFGGVSGDWLNKSAMMSQGRAGEKTKAVTDINMQQQKFVLEDKWRALEAAKAQSGFESQEMIAAMQAKIQQQLADLQKEQYGTDLHAQAIDFATMISNQTGMNISPNMVLYYLTNGT